MSIPSGQTNTSLEVDECFNQFKSKEFCKKWNSFKRNFNWVIKNAPGTFPTVYERMNKQINTEATDETKVDDKNNTPNSKTELKWPKIQDIYENPSSTFIVIMGVICVLCVIKCMCSRR